MPDRAVVGLTPAGHVNYTHVVTRTSANTLPLLIPGRSLLRLESDHFSRSLHQAVVALWHGHLFCALLACNCNLHQTVCSASGRGNAAAMAVTQDNPSITASIVVNGVALQEYDDDEGQAESTAVTKYVEAITGAEFAIQYRFDKKPKHHVRVNFLLDGKDVAGQYAFPEDFKESSLVQTSYGVMSNEGSKWQMQNYAFADLQTGMYVT